MAKELEVGNTVAYIDYVNISERNKEIVKRYAEGASYVALGTFYGISESRIWLIIVNYRRHAVKYGKEIGELRVVY